MDHAAVTRQETSCRDGCEAHLSHRCTAQPTLNPARVASWQRSLARILQANCLCMLRVALALAIPGKRVFQRRPKVCDGCSVRGFQPATSGIAAALWAASSRRDERREGFTFESCLGTFGVVVRASLPPQIYSEAGSNPSAVLRMRMNPAQSPAKWTRRSASCMISRRTKITWAVRPVKLADAQSIASASVQGTHMLGCIA